MNSRPRLSLVTKFRSELVDLIIQEEQWWARVAQVSLRNDDKFEVLKRQLNLFQDSCGLWRCRGRIHKDNLPQSTKFPIILPNHHAFTKLAIRRRLLQNSGLGIG